MQFDDFEFRKYILSRCRFCCHWLIQIKAHVPLDKMAGISADDICKCIFLNEKDKIPI